MKTETIHQTEVLELFQMAPFMDVLDEVGNCLPAMLNITDEGSRQNLPDILENEFEKEEMVCTFELLANILQNSNTVDDVATNVDAAYQQVMETYEENIMEIFSQTKPFEKTIRSLNLLYENAGGEAEVFILPVNAAKFADSLTPKHFNIMQHHLKQKWYKWVMEDSPFYIGYVGDIGSKTAMAKMAQVAMETRALFIADTKENSSMKAVVDHAKRLQIKDIPPVWAHLVVAGTFVYALGAKDVQFVRTPDGKLQRIERKMAVPAAPALIGKLLDVIPGDVISGLEKDALIGIDGVKLEYDMERLDAKELDKVGLIQIEPNGHIQGMTTANKSNNADLRKFPKVDTANALLKDLVQFCNNKSYSKWGNKQKKEFTKEIELYLNRRMKAEVIEGYEIEDISYDTLEENVNIDITVKFYEGVDEFDINMHGPKGGIDLQQEEK